jgi:hypothetical protein
MSESDEREQRLRRTRADFGALLMKLLPECARGRSGLFGHHARAVGSEVAARYYAWPEAHKLLALSDEITALEQQVKDAPEFPLHSSYLAYRASQATEIPSEPKLALRFLQELKRAEFARRGLPTNIERYTDTDDMSDDETEGYE